MTMSDWGQLELTHGQVARVSPEDIEELGQHRWYAKWSPAMRAYYAVRRSPGVNGKGTMILMHRAILNAPRGTFVDHANRDTLDNRRENIRLATPAQNMRNRAKNRRNRSGLKGVCWHKQANKWQAQIELDKKNIYLGLHDTKESAHAAYVAASAKYHGEFGRTA